MPKLFLSSISTEIDNKSLLKDVSLELNTGELVALVGPNGAGKSTLLQTALGLTEPLKGSIELDGEDIQTLSSQARAKRIAYLPQSRPLAWPMLVKDVVALGRFAYGTTSSSLSKEDAEIVQQVMANCHITHLAQRQTDQLSGGELARVHCARAFAAKAPLLLADEPVTALDPKHQLSMMQLLKTYVSQGSGALVVMHDIALAARFADRLIWMKEGRLIADGPGRQTLTPALLAEVFAVEATVDWQGDIPTVTLLSPAA
jgi:iron complex transport system ATP-binding protein